MASLTGSQLPVIRSDDLRPYVSLTILEVCSDSPADEFARFIEKLKRWSVRARVGSKVVVAAGLETPSSEPWDEWISADRYQIDAFAVRHDQSPSWTKSDSTFIDRSHDLTIVMRWGRLIGVHTDAGTREAIQRWLDKPPRPALRRIPEGALNAAFLRGEAKGLWLRGTHTRRATKADSKNLAGSRLQDALSPYEDSSFAMGTARASFPNDPSSASLAGVTVGTTPRNSLVWSRATQSAEEFLAHSKELLLLVEDVLSSGITVEQPFPLLATRADDLENVRGAFDLTVLHPEDISLGNGASDELLDAATILQGATLEMKGDAASSSFQLMVGLDGTVGGSLTGRLIEKKDKVTFTFGYRGEPTNGPPVRLILDALNRYGNDLLTVYYESGHTVLHGGVWKRSFRGAPFPNWLFEDFSGVDITKEKPDFKNAQEIHDAINSAGDDSIFGWVVRHYSNGWLICDDGSGEVADFVHIHPETAELALIHVKGAKSRQAARQVAVGPFEVVASQATKNVRYLSAEELRERLKAPAVERPGCWENGERVESRKEFLEMLEARSSIDRAKVIIVQPHVSERLYKGVQSDRERQRPETHNALRLSLLEAVLNTVRASVVGLGADLDVVGSKA